MCLLFVEREREIETKLDIEKQPSLKRENEPVVLYGPARPIFCSVCAFLLFEARHQKIESAEKRFHSVRRDGGRDTGWGKKEEEKKKQIE